MSPQEKAGSGPAKAEICRAFSETADAYIIYGNMTDPDLYYASRFLASDSFTYILLASGHEILLVSEMEKNRALKESCVRDVRTTGEYDLRKKAAACRDASFGYAGVIEELLQKENVRKAAFPYNAPAFLYEGIRTGKAGIDVTLAKSPFLKARSIKSEEESACIEESMRGTEAAMEAAIDMIRKAGVRDGFLISPGTDRPLTGAEVLTEIDRVLTEHNDLGDETIVSCAEDSADPHGKTYGPLRAGQPIVIDIFPMNKRSRYFSDMTRTVLKGKASPELTKLYEAVRKAQEAGIAAARPGVTCADVHNRVCDVLEEAGYDTIRSGATVGFIHTTGHGVGLEIHEQPGVYDNDHVLVPGNVITIEPGLYYPGLGGIRIEDTVIITENGCRNYNKAEKVFEV